MSVLIKFLLQIRDPAMRPLVLALKSNPNLIALALIMSMNKSWQELARARKQTQQSSIPEDWKIKIRPPDGANVTLIPATCGLLTARELEITDELDVDVLLRKLATREWTSLEVTQAYLKRAILAHQLVSNVVTL